MKTSVAEETRIPEAQAPLQVLILEHSAPDIELMLFELKDSGMNINHRLAGSADEFRQALREGSFDAILADYRLPDWTGIEALKELRATKKEIPFLLVTGTLGEEAAVECMKEGVSDYVLKEHLSRLPVALKRAIQESALRQENARAYAALAESEARNCALVENSVYGIFRATADGAFLDANPALVTSSATLNST